MQPSTKSKVSTGEHRACAPTALLLAACIAIVSFATACTPEEKAPAAATAGLRPVPDDVAELGTKKYSQFNEELLVQHYFNGRRDGFFLDVGCFKWFEGSTTARLELEQGWKGFAIDAQPALRAGWEEHRPGSRFFNYLVMDHSGTVETLYMAGGLSSVNEDHLDLFPKAKEMDLKPKPIQVPTITLNDLLEREGIEKVDFLSMDIEGAEPGALAGFDIEKYRPDLVVIEAEEQTRKTILE